MLGRGIAEGGTCRLFVHGHQSCLSPGTERQKQPRVLWPPSIALPSAEDTLTDTGGNSHGPT